MTFFEEQPFTTILTKMSRRLHIILVTSFVVAPFARSEICSICPNSTHVPLAGNSASFVLYDELFSCDEAAELAAEGVFPNCTILHNRAAEICQCKDPSVVDEPFACPLCGEGEILPLPFRVIANRTCQEREERAAADFEMDCTTYQKSFGSYCGCNIVSDPNHFDGFCRICNDTLLPDPSKKVVLESTQDGQTVSYSKYCVELEQDFNTDPNLDCGRMQMDYGSKSACDCSYDIEIPTREPSIPILFSSALRISHSNQILNFLSMGMMILLS